MQYITPIPLFQDLGCSSIHIMYGRQVKNRTWATLPFIHDFTHCIKTLRELIILDLSSIHMIALYERSIFPCLTQFGQKCGLFWATFPFWYSISIHSIMSLCDTLFPIPLSFDQIGLCCFLPKILSSKAVLALLFTM